MSDSDEEGKDKQGDSLDKDQLRRMEANGRKGTKFDKKRKRMENRGIKVDTDSDENSLDVDEESGEEEEGALKKLQAKKKKEEEKAAALEHNPIKKNNEEIRKSLFLGAKYGHYKMGTYVRVEIQVEKKFSRQL